MQSEFLINASKTSEFSPNGASYKPLVGEAKLLNIMKTLSLPNEKWKLIPNSNCYMVSTCGRMKRITVYEIKNDNYYKRIETERILSLKQKNNTYPRLIISENGNKSTKLIHILVAKTFIPNPNKLPEVNHKNGIKNDNRVENLEWCTHPRNIIHSHEIGLVDVRGEKHHLTRITNKDVVFIRKNCRINYTPLELAKMFNITRRNVYDIVLKRTWKHI